MSYDIQIHKDPHFSEYRDYDPVAAFINALPGIENFRFRIGEQYYMEIDIEKTIDEGESEAAKKNGQFNVINLHIPYAYMESYELDYDEYFNLSLRIAEYLNWRAYDLQKDLYLDDPKFFEIKHRKLHSNLLAGFDGMSFKKLEWKLDGWRRRGFSSKGYRIDCIVNFQENKIHVKASDTERSLSFKVNTFAKSPDGHFLANYNREEKALEIWQISGSGEEIDENNFKQYGRQVHTIKRCGKIQNLAFSTDSKELFSVAFHSKTLKRWDIGTGKLIKNYSGYGLKGGGPFLEINDKLLAFLSGGLCFFDRDSAELLVTLNLLTDNWIAYTPDGRYDSEKNFHGALELTWIDNDRNESYVFIPELGFAYFERWGSFKLNKVQKAKGKKISGLFFEALKDYI